VTRLKPRHDLPQKPFLMAQKPISNASKPAFNGSTLFLMPQNLFLDSKLKPKGESLTI
jgi:hypothetical protein